MLLASSLVHQLNTTFLMSALLVLQIAKLAGFLVVLHVQLHSTLHHLHMLHVFRPARPELTYLHLPVLYVAQTVQVARELPPTALPALEGYF